MENRKVDKIEISEREEKIKIPIDVQKRLLEFFMQTSIPRKKARSNHLPEEKKDR